MPLNFQEIGRSFINTLIPGAMKEKPKEIPVATLHDQFLRGKITISELAQVLTLKQVNEFIKYHNEVYVELEKKFGNTAPAFKLAQLDKLTQDAGRLEKEVAEAHGINLARRIDN